MSSRNCPNARRKIVGMSLLVAALIGPGLAQAKLLEPTYAGPLSNGSFSGLPIRADAAVQSSRQPLELVGENCYVVQHKVKNAGRIVAYNEPICE